MSFTSILEIIDELCLLFNDSAHTDTQMLDKIPLLILHLQTKFPHTPGTIKNQAVCGAIERICPSDIKQIILPLLPSIIDACILVAHSPLFLKNMKKSHDKKSLKKRLLCFC